jgi:hypothetical protein
MQVVQYPCNTQTNSKVEKRNALMSAPIACNGESPDLRLREHIRNRVQVHSDKISNKLSDHVIVETSQYCILRLMAMLINDARSLSKKTGLPPYDQEQV